MKNEFNMEWVLEKLKSKYWTTQHEIEWSQSLHKISAKKIVIHHLISKKSLRLQVRRERIGLIESIVFHFEWSGNLQFMFNKTSFNLFVMFSLSVDTNLNFILFLYETIHVPFKERTFTLYYYHFNVIQSRFESVYEKILCL